TAAFVLHGWWRAAWAKRSSDAKDNLCKLVFSTDGTLRALAAKFLANPPLNLKTFIPVEPNSFPVLRKLLHMLLDWPPSVRTLLLRLCAPSFDLRLNDD